MGWEENEGMGQEENDRKGWEENEGRWKGIGGERGLPATVEREGKMKFAMWKRLLHQDEFTVSSSSRHSKSHGAEGD